MKPKKKSQTLVEGVSESTTACLFAMVQGNVLTLTLSHLAIAAQTGIVAGTLALGVIVVAKIENPWITALLLGLLTAAVDFFTHPGAFGGVATEAIVTGVMAGLASLLVSHTLTFFRRRNQAAKPSSP